MAHLNHKGPDELGPKTGRKLGRCKKSEEETIQTKAYKLGHGLSRNNKNKDCKGYGKRLHAGKNIL